MLLSCYVFPQGLRMVLIRANSSPSLSMPRWELLIPVRCYVRVVRTHLHPPTDGESYPSCMNVTNGLSLSLGASSPTPSPLGKLASPMWMLLTLLCLSLGAAHGVDSSELAFRLAAIGAMREGKEQHVRSHGHSQWKIEGGCGLILLQAFCDRYKW